MRRSRTLILAGAYAGKNIILYGIRFRNGRVTLSGEESFDGTCNLLAKSYQAYEEHSDTLKAAQERDRKFLEENPNGYGNSEKAPKQRSRDGFPSEVSPPSKDSGSEKTPNGTGHDDTESRGPGLSSDGDRHGSEVEPEQDFDSTLKQAILSLDPSDLDLWTDEHERPRIDAINERLPESMKIVKRGTWEQVVPGYNRRVAEEEWSKDGKHDSK